MRVFFALTFHEKDKEKIGHYRDLIANHAIKGRFTSQENFHLTLEFIGEVRLNQTNELCIILNKLTHFVKDIHIEHIGAFKRKDKNILWLGIEKNPTLKKLHQELISHLEDYAYKIEKRRYTPHITLGRQIIIQENISDWMIEPFTISIKSIALMESRRDGDKLIYEAIEEIIIN